MNVPTCDTVISTHLDTATIDACLRKDHKPINPHSQRLLTAEARAVSKLPAGEAKAKATAKAKGKKAKAQAEAKEAEDNGEAGEEPQDGEEEPTEPPAKKAKKDKKQKDLEKQKESGVLRSKYSAVKLAFFDQPSLPSWFYSLCFLSYVYHHGPRLEPYTRAKKEEMYFGLYVLSVLQNKGPKPSPY